MYTRTTITRYVLALAFSAILHGILFRGSWLHGSINSAAQIQLHQGARAVELNLIPSVASQAKKTTPAPPPAPTQNPKPVKEIIPQAEPEIFIPEPEPDPLETDVQPELSEEAIAPEPATETEPFSVDSVEQTGAQQSQGVTAQATSEINPVYPRRSNLLGEEGTVTIGATISATGLLLKSVIIKSSGFRRLDQSAIKAVNQATFTPAIQDGKPVEELVILNFKFELQT